MGGSKGHERLYRAGIWLSAHPSIPWADEGTVLSVALVDLLVTCVDEAEANMIRLALLEQRLIACGNSWPISSAYRWNDSVEQAAEVMLLVKTTEDRRTEVVGVIDKLHSYDLPAVSIVRVEAGSPEFERWVEESTRPSVV